MLAQLHLNVWDKVVYYAIWAIGWPIVRWYWRASFVGGEHVRDIHGSAIVAPTHRSFVDPMIAGQLTTRPLRPLAKIELFHGVLGYIYRRMGACPIRRGEVDRDALYTASAWLQNDELMIVFPEGTRKTGTEVTDLQAGVGYLAAKNKVPVIPVAIVGAEQALPKHARFLRPVKVRVEVGVPLYADPDMGWRDAANDLTKRLQEEMQRLYNEAAA